MVVQLTLTTLTLEHSSFTNLNTLSGWSLKITPNFFLRLKEGGDKERLEHKDGYPLISDLSMF